VDIVGSLIKCWVNKASISLTEGLLCHSLLWVVSSHQLKECYFK
jgi:hypothetical protein